MATKKEAAANEEQAVTREQGQNAADETAATQAEQILANAKAEADKIISDAKAKAKKELEAAEEAAQSAPDPAADPGEELVSVRLFKDNDRYKDDVFVAVNGERIQIKRGETVQIKRKFADVLEQSMQQDMATANMIERKSSEYEAKAAALGV